LNGGGVAIIDPEGIFNGDRLRRCSNEAQLHWPRLFLASNGHARIELNYSKLTGRAYANFNPVPSAEELRGYIREYEQNSLLFLYEVDGQTWGQWDTRPELLPRYKTAPDKRSPAPPEPAFNEWKRRYREDAKAFPKSFVNVSEPFLHGVGEGVGVGKNIRASPDGNAREGDLLALVDQPPFETTEPGSTFGECKPKAKRTKKQAGALSPEQEQWFRQWWSIWWRLEAKKAARQAFGTVVTTAEMFEKVMAATRAQSPEMLRRETKHRPQGATWLNGERWEDKAYASIGSPPAAQSVPTMADIARGREIDAALAAGTKNPFANLTGRRPS
jgi:hypothetical protein